MPDLFEGVVEQAGEPGYDRFREYEVSIHILANLGQFFSLVAIMAVMKVIVYGIWRLAKS